MSSIESPEKSREKSTTLISVIIPCYNHSAYLLQAIDSVLAQNYPSLEIIVIDDGSTDNTRQVSLAYPQVSYVFQQNAGLSAARNKGIDQSKGKYLLFLDADDWLLENALITNAYYLNQYPQLAFVSGAHVKVFTTENHSMPVSHSVDRDHYLRLLEGNFIGMHATVMYRKSIFDKYRYDTSLKACEDYDLYLRIAREHPVFHHRTPIAAYRIHQTNMSSNGRMMLQQALKVQERQLPLLKTHQERNAFNKGQRFWKDYYTKEIYYSLRKFGASAENTDLQTLWKYNTALYLRYYLTKFLLPLKRFLKI